jgi:hypothetical protein
VSFSPKKLIDEIAMLKANYPYVSKSNKDRNGENEEIEYLFFFQTEAQKENFLKEIEGLWFEDVQFHVVIGQALGFPPLAVQYWVDREADEALQQYHVGLYWWGIACAAHMKDVVKNVEWIWEKYPVQEDWVEMPIEISYAKYTDTVVNGVTRFESKRIRLEIEHNNKEQLEEVKRQLEEMCERWYGNEK